MGYKLVNINNRSALLKDNNYRFSEMKTDFKGNLTPQTEEGITKVCWVNKEDIAQKLENSFGNIIELLKA